MLFGTSFGTEFDAKCNGFLYFWIQKQEECFSKASYDLKCIMQQAKEQK